MERLGGKGAGPWARWGGAWGNRDESNTHDSHRLYRVSTETLSTLLVYKAVPLSAPLSYAPRR